MRIEEYGGGGAGELAEVAGTSHRFVAMAKTWDYSRMDFVCEVSTNRKAVYLNFLFWAQFDFNAQAIGVQHRDSTIAHLSEAWEFNHIEIPLPACG